MASPTSTPLFGLTLDGVQVAGQILSQLPVDVAHSVNAQSTLQSTLSLRYSLRSRTAGRRTILWF